MTRFTICSNQYTSAPWRPMFPPVPMCAIAVGAAEKSAAVRRMSSGDKPVTEATASASNGAMNSRRSSTLTRAPAQQIVVPTVEPVDLREQRGEQIRVGVGLDLQVVAESHLDGADAARVHEGHVAAAARMPRMASIAFGTETAVR